MRGSTEIGTPRSETQVRLRAGSGNVLGARAQIPIACNDTKLVTRKSCASGGSDKRQCVVIRDTERKACASDGQVPSSTRVLGCAGGGAVRRRGFLVRRDGLTQKEAPRRTEGPGSRLAGARIA